MSVKLNSSGGGSVTLQEPTTASNFTLTLPAQTATVITDSSAILNIGSGQIYKDASGNVGIGTSSPSALLHVSNASAKIRIGVDASSQYTDIYRDNATGYTVYNAAQAAPFRGHIWQLGGSEAMRIDTSGNVGIGTSSPDAIFQSVKTSAGAATVCAYLQNSSGTTSTEVRLAFGANSNSISDNRYAWIGCVNTGGTNGGALTFATTPGGTPATERARIDASGNFLFNSGYGSVATAYGCRAWVNFNGTGTVAIRASGNVSSITDNNTGDYTVNFSSAMPDVNYCTQGTTGAFTPNITGDRVMYVTGDQTATSSVRVRIRSSAVSAFDDAYCFVAVFR